MAALFFTGSSKEHLSLSKEDTYASKQRTIFEALKIKERDSRVTQCLGCYQNKQPVESFKEDVMIRRISCKLLFEREREKGKYQCYLDKWHGNCVSWSRLKAKHPEETQRLSETRQGSVFTVKQRNHPWWNKTKDNWHHKKSCSMMYWKTKWKPQTSIELPQARVSSRWSI